MTDYGKIVSNTPQKEKAEQGQIENSAGGYVFEADKWTLLDRFLIMGVTGNTYYANQRDVVRQNVHSLEECITEDGTRVVNRVLTIRRENRAFKMEPLIYAMALCMKKGDYPTRKLAHENIRVLCGTFHMLTTLLNVRKDMALGWGRGMRNGVADWFLHKSPDYLLYQALKYPQRNGWTQRDVLRKSHPNPTGNEDLNAVLRFIASKPENKDEHAMNLHENHELPLAVAVHDLRMNPTPANAVALIKQHNLTREMIPTELLTDAKVWETLNEKMPLGATVRNLGKMSSIGVIDVVRGNDAIHARLHNEDIVRRSRMHPMQFMIAQKVYSNGKGVRGNLTWMPSQIMQTSLEHAFYSAMKSMEPTGKSIMVGVDISGSMTSRNISDEIPFTPAEVAGTLSCVMAHVEPYVHIMGFSDRFIPLNINSNTTIQDSMKKVQGNFGRTDCALPMLYGLGFNAEAGGGRWNSSGKYVKTHNPINVDAFIILTDNETWFGKVHPHQALAQYRAEVNADAKLIVVAMQAAGRAISIADPNDLNSLDIVGFDSAVPQLIQEFISS